MSDSSSRAQRAGRGSLRRCRPTRVSSSMTAPAAAHCCGRSRSIAVCSVPMFLWLGSLPADSESGWKIYLLRLVVFSHNPSMSKPVSIALHQDPLNIIKAQVLAPLRVRAWFDICGHILRRAAVLQRRRDPGRPKTMIADLSRDAGRYRTPADHPPRRQLEAGGVSAPNSRGKAG